MPDGSGGQSGHSWTDVGVHPTPLRLVRKFARAVSAAVAHSHQAGMAINVLDACSGDGRLGHAVARRLSNMGFRPHLTLVEADARRISDLRAGYEVHQVLGNFFDFCPSTAFDVVVSNPPYLAIGREQARRLGFEWPHVVESGRNLYGLALRKCVSVCRSSGVVGVLAPYGWIRNWHGGGLRAFVNSRVERVDVFASTSRRLFPGVHQDVAVQIFKLRSSIIFGAAASVRISYDRSSFDRVELANHIIARTPTGARVRVGPFVWNRQTDLLSARARGIPVVYGGNITSGGALDFNIARYRGRQFVAKSRVPPVYISGGACILIKRSLRGVPGNWKLDAAVSYGERLFVAENHVIVIELSDEFDDAKIQLMRGNIIQIIEYEHRHYGHPNVSVETVRRALETAQGV